MEPKLDFSSFFLMVNDEDMSIHSCKFNIHSLSLKKAIRPLTKIFICKEFQAQFVSTVTHYGLNKNPRDIENSNH